LLDLAAGGCARLTELSWRHSPREQAWLDQTVVLATFNWRKLEELRRSAAPRPGSWCLPDVRAYPQPADRIDVPGNAPLKARLRCRDGAKRSPTIPA
jgi:hypothetical protein